MSAARPAGAYAPARWLPGPHAMTVFASLARPFPRLAAVRQRWELPDGDFVDVDRIPAPDPEAPVVVVCHGLEGSSTAGYVRVFAAEARRARLAVLAMNFRGCSGEPNRLPRLYHSGDTGDLWQVVRRLVAERPGRALLLAGYSLGGNVVAKLLGELGDDLPAEVRAAAVVSVPFDLARSARAIDGPGLMPLVYRERFLRRLRRKALEKARRFPGLVDARAVRSARSFAEFDERVTAPIHGFAGAAEYWSRSSSGRTLPGVRRPLLAIASLDDPMVPPESLPLDPSARSPSVTLDLQPAGGHVGFVAGMPWRPGWWAERRAVEFLAGCARGGGALR